MKSWLIAGILVLILLTTSLSTGIPFNGNQELISPSDRIKEDQIFVYNDRIVITIDNAEWTSYTDTNSMDPLIDETANGLELVPKNENELYVGDVVAYEPTWAEGLIVHRIVEKNHDENGTYFILRGDNNTTSDPGKVRFKQIKYVLIGVLY